jgi:hypothetical protein
MRPELCGGAVTVSFSKYLPWQATRSLQCCIHFSEMCCRPFAAGQWNRRCATPAATRFIFHVRFSIYKQLPSPKTRGSSHCIVSIGLMDELWGFWSNFSKLNTEFNRATLLLFHPRKDSFKPTVNRALTSVRVMKITPLLRYPHHYNLA